MDLLSRLNPFASSGTVHVELANTCNGYRDLCDRQYSNVTFAASHNAAFVGDGLAHNQLQTPEQGLDMGIRYFTTPVHIGEGEIRQCHSDCGLLDAGPLVDIVVTLKTWLDEHPREVVTLLIGNGDDAIPIEDFMPIFKEAKAEKITFKPGGKLKKKEWPTLKEMIDKDERLVVFMGRKDSFLYLPIFPDS